jgi:adenylosuccinate lyase
VQQHERDGRGWKAEWVAFPEVCLLTGAALQTARDLLAGLEVDAQAMAAKVDDRASSERVLAALTARLGKHEAQARMHEAIEPGAGHVERLEVAVRGLLGDDELAALLAHPAVEGAAAMVDVVVARARAARLVEPETWA